MSAIDRAMGQPDTRLDFTNIAAEITAVVQALHRVRFMYLYAGHRASSPICVRLATHATDLIDMLAEERMRGATDA